MRHLMMCVVLMITVALSAQTQSNQFTSLNDSDPASKQILDQMKATYTSYKTLEANFTLTIELPEEDPEIQKGTIKQSGDQYNLTLQNQSIISNGKTLWFHQIANNEVQVNTVDPDISDEDEMLSPQNIMKFYDTGKFIAAPVVSAQEDDRSVRWIELKPVDPDSEYFKYRISIDSQKDEIIQVKAFSRDGSRFALKIDQLTPNKTFAATTFQFDKAAYPGIRVEDLRTD